MFVQDSRRLEISSESNTGWSSKRKLLRQENIHSPLPSEIQSVILWYQSVTNSVIQRIIKKNIYQLFWKVLPIIPDVFEHVSGVPLFHALSTSLANILSYNLFIVGIFVSWSDISMSFYGTNQMDPRSKRLSHIFYLFIWPANNHAKMSKHSGLVKQRFELCSQVVIMEWLSQKFSSTRWQTD